MSRIGWPERWLGLWVAVLTVVTGRHHYLSTSCTHRECGHCRSAVNEAGGAKEPGSCKWGPERCVHRCHGRAQAKTSPNVGA